MHSDFTTGFLQRYLSTPESTVNTNSQVYWQDDNLPVPHATLQSQSPAAFLEEWAKLRLEMGSWKDTLSVAVNVICPCSNTPRESHIPLVRSLGHQDSRFIELFVKNFMHRTR